MLERIRHERTVDIYGHVTCLRAQRNYMVQTEDQYIFIHDALLEAVQSGNTEISARSLYGHIQKLTQPLTDGSTGMDIEFKVSHEFTGSLSLSAFVSLIVLRVGVSIYVTDLVICHRSSCIIVNLTLLAKNDGPG